ncbi:MAG: pentapeptide repeat-containing protein [Nitrospinaceae bacterium]|nr:pentapeptide repeat-containing protein [Nitrospinaceae bacterium]NIR57047.1 pentapeptide repeat-containing protein [Nitrospinaceae bacterium]NIS87502.1 pentapeptide repeat-containing protein [Nitrospinaceae bacterium]NIT84356.1 pentapeptide repeat-containing protein [Nitrospinaceae bacterium]NIU46543.1 pentapeptide repeat-containing protein [Nitrospinaceae bacterium]
MLEEWVERLNKVEAGKDDLAGADLSHYKLMKARLQGANLSGADLSFAYLMQADLTGADLSDVDFTSAVLSEATLQGANLENADFTEAYLCGVDLSQTLNLTCDQLELAYLDRETQLPDYIRIKWLSDVHFECQD